MDQRPIGVFDSGLGGLTAAKVLEELLPRENMIYFGDNGNAPYGVRSQAEIIALASADLDFLLSFDCKAVLAACGTVCANAMDALKARTQVPIFGVIDPACALAARKYPGGRTAVIATEASVRSGAFDAALKAADPTMQVFSQPCQPFVTLAEQGRFLPGDRELEETAAELLAPVKAWKPDVMLLACTHFPLLAEVIGSFMGPETELISVSAAAAEALRDRLTAEDALAERRTGERRWYTSGDVDSFARYGGSFLGHAIAPEKGGRV